MGADQPRETSSSAPSLAFCSVCRLEVPPFSLELDPSCSLCETTDSHASTDRGLSVFPSEAAFIEALVRWQKRAGFDTLEGFIPATFVLADARALYDAYKRSEVIELVSDPFGFGGGMVHDREDAEEPAPVTSRMSNVPLISREQDSSVALAHAELAAATSSAALPSFPIRSRAPLYPLASVAAADGLVSVDERWFLDECLKRYGEPPAREDEVRVYPPLDWASAVPVALRPQVAFDMCTLAMIDGLPDAAEARMIYAYCIEWRIPTEEARKYLIQLQHKNTSLSRRLWLRLRDYLLPGRWENTQL